MINTYLSHISKEFDQDLVIILENSGVEHLDKVVHVLFGADHHPFFELLLGIFILISLFGVKQRDSLLQIGIINNVLRRAELSLIIQRSLASEHISKFFENLCNLGILIAVGFLILGKHFNSFLEEVSLQQSLIDNQCLDKLHNSKKSVGTVE